MREIEGTKSFGAYIDRTIRMIKLDLVKRFRELDIDITPEQWVILASLYDNNGQTQTELGDGSFKNAPTVSRIINLLCKKGLTERRSMENDGRQRAVFLTEKGRAIVEKSFPAVKATRQKGWQRLSDDDYDHLIRILDTIFDNFRIEE